MSNLWFNLRNRAARILTDSNCKVDTDNILQNLVSPEEVVRDKFRATMVYKSLYMLVPEFLRAKFSKYSLRDCANKGTVPLYRVLCKSLPYNARQTKSLTKFKQSIKCAILDTAFVKSSVLCS